MSLAQARPQNLRFAAKPTQSQPYRGMPNRAIEADRLCILSPADEFALRFLPWDAAMTRRATSKANTGVRLHPSGATIATQLACSDCKPSPN